MNKLSLKTLILFGLLVALCQAQTATITDWTKENASYFHTGFSPYCTDQIKNVEFMWTGDCEGSYAATIASVVQDNICITFGKTTTDAKLKNLAKMKVSAQELLCHCYECHQFPGQGCSGGKIEDSLKHVQDNGFVGGTISGKYEVVDTTGITWKAPFAFTYNECLPFFKTGGYCELGAIGTSKCEGKVNPEFNPTDKAQCGEPDQTDFKCVKTPTVKVSAARQKGLVTYTKVANGIANIKTAVQKGPLIGVMEVFSDIYLHKKEHGVYIPTTGGSLGNVAVKVVGYEEANGQIYWLVYMPFDKRVGDNGLVKVQGGMNIGNLEIQVYQVTIKTDIFTP